MSKQTTLNILKTYLYQIEDLENSKHLPKEEREGVNEDINDLRKAIKWVEKQ